MFLVFADGMEYVSDNEIEERWAKADSGTRQPSKYVVCKPEHQQYFELIGMEFVDDLSDTEQ